LNEPKGLSRIHPEGSSRRKVKIAPSILSADFSRLGEQVAEVVQSGADYIHLDVMDGHFVPQITLGAPLVKALRPWTNLPFDAHLMVASPESQIDHFAEAGADIITVHLEVCSHLHRVVEQIKRSGLKAGVALNPATPISMLEEILPQIDLVTVMTVNPGWGGQPFIEPMLDKIARLRNKLDESKLDVELEVDGGITPITAPKVVQAGADVLVAGAAVFKSQEGIKRALQSLRESFE
jgi:ribulose-phosphate 3-epimerase